MTEVLKMLPEAAGRGQHFRARGHSFSLYGPTLRRSITFLSFSSCRKLAYNWVCLRNFALESAYAPSTNHSQKIERANERVNQIIYEERCNKEQIYFELLYVSAFSSLVCFPGVKFRAKFEIVLENSFCRSLRIPRLN